MRIIINIRNKLLKLKAKPERLMPMVEIILRFVNPVAVASSKIVSEEYLPVLCKFLKSPKQNIRESSSLILQYLAQGYSCPRKMLINSEVEIVEVDDELIRNINTPEEYAAAKNELN